MSEEITFKDNSTNFSEGDIWERRCGFTELYEVEYDSDKILRFHMIKFNEEPRDYWVQNTGILNHMYFIKNTKPKEYTFDTFSRLSLINE